MAEWTKGFTENILENCLDNEERQGRDFNVELFVKKKMILRSRNPSGLHGEYEMYYMSHQSALRQNRIHLTSLH